MHLRTLILGAGAAGLHCAAHAGPDTLVIDHAKNPAEKVRISGGGRCNFTNLGVEPSCFLSENPHFAKSALKRYTQWDFIDLVDRYKIAWHEKTLGQLFCDESAKQIIAMLMSEVRAAGNDVWLQTALVDLHHDGSHFVATLEREGQRQTITAAQLVVATGGKSIPKMGATGLAYEIAEQFGHRLTETRPALVPFTFPDGRFKPLAGVAAPAQVRCGPTSFDEAVLFTHRGLSGPAILQISSYWSEGADIEINLCPTGDLAQTLKTQKKTSGRKQITTELAQHLPARLIQHLAQELSLAGNLADHSDARIDEIAASLSQWRLRPQGTEGYRTAEVTLGGVATDALSSKTMESRTQGGLFFIGEAVDVTGWLGGYNFQWAWSSAYAAATEIATRY
ncbi:NAD(P)/FAD-dependent oxidoreductase [Primorskyibacter sp. S187A]|uniref:NAD(P)/FAD-dependent oxidoreductase n=1 Tax=Primorskyibacter sp. S187A TaxID=3415130 RepID=UPI003C7B56A0